MKAYQILFMGAAVALAMNSCNFFDSESPSALDSKTVYSSTNLTKQAIAGVYEKFGNDKSYRNRLACGYVGLNTDAEYCNKSSCVWAWYSLTPAWGDLTNSKGKDPWNYLLAAGECCNNIIEGIEQYGDTTDETMQNYRGEAYFLRAFCYLELVKIWGEAPVTWQSLSKNPENTHQGLVYRNDIYEHNRADLKKAIEYLDWSADQPSDMKNNVGRPSKGAALALLMRNDMYYAGKSVHRTNPAGMLGVNGYTDFTPDDNVDEETRLALYKEVVAAMDMLETRESGKLLANYVDVFKAICQDVTDYTKTEVMWEIPFANGNRGQFLNYNCPKSADALLGLKNNTSGSTNSIQAVVPTLYYEFENGDKRRDVTFFNSQWIYDNGTSFNADVEKVKEAFPGEDGTSEFLYMKLQSIGGWYLGKYRVEWMSRERNGNDDGVDFPIIRYADCLLLAAEADLYVNSGKAATWLNKVRSRAGLGGVSATLENIQKERKFELTGEYVRKWDLMRWGNLQETMLATRTQLNNMSAHTDKFENLPDTIYYKYRAITAEDDLLYSSAVHGYVIDSIWGLKPGETSAPASYVKDSLGGHNGWIKKNIYMSTSGSELSTKNYVLYINTNPEYLNERQYYPIFATDNAANFPNSYNYK